MEIVDHQEAALQQIVVQAFGFGGVKVQSCTSTA